MLEPNGLEQVRQSLMTASVRAAGAFSKSCSRIDRDRFPVPAYKITLGLQSPFLVFFDLTAPS
jgi:hypothetical protein